MKIRKMTATFGTLRRQTLELKDGLNIIEAPNESGKSTWAGFLRAMLYGIDTKERNKKGVIAEKNRYQPWDGGTMEGVVELSHGAQEITLRRTGKANAPMSRFEAVYTGTEESVPGLAGDNAGEVLTGVGREVFERSAFVGQGFMPVTGSAELERRISAIVSSGQEDVSYSETEQQLRDWKNRRQSNQKNGLIPRLEEEKATVTATLDRLEGANRQAAELRERIAALEEEKSLLNEQLAAHQAQADAQTWQRYTAALAEEEKARSALDALHQERQRRGTPPEESALRSIQGDLTYLTTLDSNIKQARREAETISVPSMDIPHPVFSGMGPQSARSRAQSDAVTVNTRDKGKAQFTLFTVAYAVLGALALAVGIILPSLPLILLAAVFFAGIVILLFRRRKTVKAASAILTAYGVTHGSAILEQAEDYARRWEEAEKIRTDATVRAVTLERMQAERDELTERLLSKVRTFAPEVTDLYGVSAAVSLALNQGSREQEATARLESAQKVLQALTAHGIPHEAHVPDTLPATPREQAENRLRTVTYELQRSSEALAMAQGEMNTLGDMTALHSRLKGINEKLEQRREEYQAITVAMDALKQANAALQQRMSPALNRRAGELLNALTGGRYGQVSLTREFEALAAREQDVTAHAVQYLSKGTADQLYLAVRLAVCDLVLSGDEKAPLVLDDALVNFDDTRLALALDLLKELGKERQILLFTCQSRERRYLEGTHGVHITQLSLS